MGKRASTRASGARRVVVVAGAAETEPAATIASILAEMGLPVETVGSHVQPDCDAAIVLMGPEAGVDPAWRAGLDAVLAANPRCRLIPVRSGDFDPASLDRRLAELQWIDWPGDDQERTVADMFDVLISDPVRYQQRREVEAQAEQWILAGRPAGLLLGDVFQARKAQSLLAASLGDRIAPPSDAFREFVEASWAEAVGRRRRVGTNWTLLAVVVGVAAIVVAGLVFAVQRQQANTELLVNLTDAVLFSEADDALRGASAAALVEIGNEAEQAIGAHALRNALSSTWPTSFIGGNHDTYFFDAAVTAHGDVVTVDGHGSLARWDKGTSTITWRRGIEENTYSVDGLPDGSLIAVGTDSGVRLFDGSGRSTVRLALDEPAWRVALSPATRSVAVVTESGRLLNLGLEPPFRIAEVRSGATVLDLRRIASGATWALLTDAPDRLDVVDVSSGLIVATLPLALPATGRLAVLSSDGRSLAAVRADRQLMVGLVTADLRPTGRSVPESIRALEMTANGLVVDASNPTGVTVFDIRAGVVALQLQMIHPAVNFLRSSDDGRRLLVGDYLAVAVYETEGMGSIEVPTQVEFRSESPVARSGETSVEATADGSVRFRHADGDWYTMRVTGNSIERVAIRDDGRSIAAGSVTGEVVQIDAATRDLVGRWQTPDGAPIVTLGWSASGRLLVQTRPGWWWSPPTCSACGDYDQLLDVFRSRAWGCYPVGSLADIPAAARVSLALQICPRSIAPQSIQP